MLSWLRDLLTPPNCFVFGMVAGVGIFLADAWQQRRREKRFLHEVHLLHRRVHRIEAELIRQKEQAKTDKALDAKVLKFKPKQQA